MITDIPEGFELVAWFVEYENGDQELWFAADLPGEIPAFGETATPLFRRIEA